MCRARQSSNYGLRTAWRKHPDGGTRPAVLPLTLVTIQTQTGKPGSPVPAGSRPTFFARPIEGRQRNDVRPAGALWHARGNGLILDPYRIGQGGASARIALAHGGDAPAALPPCCKHRRCWVAGRQNHEQARACGRENFVVTASISNEAPREQSCPSELVQLGPLPLGRSKTPSGQLLDRP